MPVFSLTGLLAAGLAITVASTVTTFLFGKDDDNHEPRPSTNSSSRPSGATWPPHQPSPPSYTRSSYTRDQTAGWPPATPDYGRSFNDSKYTSPHAGASARSQAFHQPPSAPSRSQTTVGTTATAAHNHRVFPSPAVQSRQPASTSAYARAPYQRSPDPDPAHILRSYQSSPTHPRTPYSPPAYPVDLSDSESEIEYIEDDDIAKELRERARRQHREMCNARARAKSAHKTGDSVAERMHKQEVIARRSARDQLNTRAAEMIFKQKNKGHKEGMVDLHGLYVQEAIHYAKQELRFASSRNDTVVHFIVGKGKHAKDGQAKIRPALEELCNERGLIHSLDPRNTGVLIVQLD